MRLFSLPTFILFFFLDNDLTEYQVSYKLTEL